MKSSVGTNDTENREDGDCPPVKGKVVTRKFLGCVPCPKGIVSTLVGVLCLYMLRRAVHYAYYIRETPIRSYGPIIHEFDPWFNFRATEYLEANGWFAFYNWYDYQSWYPLGRPVGATIYPGLQIVGVLMYRLLAYLGPTYAMSLIEVCCYIPAWFAVVTTLMTGLLAYEATRSRNALWIAALVMSVIPGHLHRTMGGGFDNECLALPAMMTTFFFWIRSLRNPKSWPFAFVAALGYWGMANAWGGYIYVLNMIAAHTAVCVLFDWISGQYDENLFRSYLLFMAAGTPLVMTVAPVGLQPLNSMEQVSALAVLLGMYILRISEKVRVQEGYPVDSWETFQLRVKYASRAFGGLVVLFLALQPTGLIVPMSARVRSLFIPHTHTGNPLVDSVAEHQPATASAFWKALRHTCTTWGLGTLFIIFILIRASLQLRQVCQQQRRSGVRTPAADLRNPLVSVLSSRSKASLFILLNSLVVYLFSLKMSRLVLLSANVASTFTGVTLGLLLDWSIRQFFWIPSGSALGTSVPSHVATSKSRLKKEKVAKQPTLADKWQALRGTYEKQTYLRAVLALIVMLLIFFGPAFTDLKQKGELFAKALSPQVVFDTTTGHRVTDYLDAYEWLRDSTPADARVLSWWDYGYQITGIANRTTLADGNTWNHGHIATIGKLLVSPLAESHTYIRHLADYVLVRARQDDDLSKSFHISRIASSVFDNLCPGDPHCTGFAMRGNRKDARPSKMMRESLLFNMCELGHDPEARVPSQYFTEVYSSRYHLTRIYKVTDVDRQSKKWIMDPKNRICRKTSIGTPMCIGQFPPVEVIQNLLKSRNDYETEYLGYYQR